jgi:hypothetical protein
VSEMEVTGLAHGADRNLERIPELANAGLWVTHTAPFVLRAGPVTPSGAARGSFGFCDTLDAARERRASTSFQWKNGPPWRNLKKDLAG